MPDIRRNLSGVLEPSATDPRVPLDISPYFNFDAPGILAHGERAVVIGSRGSDDNPYPQHSSWIPIGRDVTSLVFLHALAKPAGYVTGDNHIFDFADSADLLGWYEIEYEDGLTITVPLRYRWNILDLKNETGTVAYQADALARGEPTKFYAFEWNNQRLGKAIKQFRLNGSRDFTNFKGQTIPSNAVILAAVSIVSKREKPKQQDPPFPK